MLVELAFNFPDQLYVAYSLSSVCNNQVPIQLMNISPSPVKIYKGMRLGIVISETNVLLVFNENLQTEAQSPLFDHL